MRCTGPSPADEENPVAANSPVPNRLVFLFTLAGLAFYLTARPIHSNSDIAKTMNVLVMQYSGPAILQMYAVGRGTVNLPDPRQVPFVPRDCNSDDKLIEAAHRIGWAPKARFGWRAANRRCQEPLSPQRFFQERRAQGEKGS